MARWVLVQQTKGWMLSCCQAARLNPGAHDEVGEVELQTLTTTLPLDDATGMQTRDMATMGSVWVAGCLCDCKDSAVAAQGGVRR
eukprot:3892894-Amphidinium_carterae.1